MQHAFCESYMGRQLAVDTDVDLSSPVSSSVGDDSLNTTTNSSSELKNGEQQSVSPHQTSSGSLDMGNTGEVDGKREHVGEERRNTSGGLATAQPRVSTIVGDNDSQLSHPLLIIRDGPDLHSITESLLSSEFETTSIADAGVCVCVYVCVCVCVPT